MSTTPSTALLEDLSGDFGLEVSFRLDYTEQFDQAGLFLRPATASGSRRGVEVSDAVAQLGAVVTHETSDWSVAPVPEWVGRVVTVRASRSGDAVTIRARVDDDEELRLVRLAWLDPAASVSAGLLCARADPRRAHRHLHRAPRRRAGRFAALSRRGERHRVWWDEATMNRTTAPDATTCGPASGW